MEYLLTYLLTGAGGFLGSHVLEQLLQLTDDRITCIDSFGHNGSYSKIIAVTGEYRDRVSVLPHDLTTLFSPDEVDRLRDVHTVINVASGASVDASIRDPARFIGNNVGLMTNILEVGRVLDLRRFVHMTTDEVHGSDFNRGHQPSSPYAASKAAQEDICLAYGHTFGIPVQFVASSNMFGERQSSLAFIPKLVRLILSGETVQVHTSQDRPGRRFYNYVGDVARYIAGLVTGEFDGVRPQVWHHLTGQHHLDNLELACLVAEFLDVNLDYQLVEGRNVRPGYDPTYKGLPPNIHWSGQADLTPKIEQTVEWLRGHLVWT